MTIYPLVPISRWFLHLIKFFLHVSHLLLPSLVNLSFETIHVYIYFQHAFQEQNIYIKLQKTYISTLAMNAKNTLIQVMPLLLKMFLHTLFIQLVYILFQPSVPYIIIWSMLDIKNQLVSIFLSSRTIYLQVSKLILDKWVSYFIHDMLPFFHYLLEVEFS